MNTLNILIFIMIKSACVFSSNQINKNLKPYFIHNNSMNKVGITNKVAELVSSSFGSHYPPPPKYYFPNDGLILVKEDDPLEYHSHSTPPNSHLMVGMLKMLGFDSRKIGAIAINGFVFIAKMVRHGVTRVMEFMSEQTLDWYKIMNHITDKMKQRNSQPTYYYQPSNLYYKKK